MDGEGEASPPDTERPSWEVPKMPVKKPTGSRRGVT